MNPDLARIVRRSDCDCAKTCRFPEEAKHDEEIVLDISMGLTVELNLGELVRKNPNLLAINVSCNRIAVLSWQFAVRNPPKPFGSLVWLDLSHNMLSGVPIDLPKACPHLVHLDLSSNHFTDLSTVQHLGGLLSLHHVDFSYNQVQNLAGLQHLTSVVQLDLHRNRIESVTPLIGCLRLERLNIAHNSITSVAECLTCIGKLPQLHTLDVYGNPFCIENGNTDFRSAFALKTRIIFLDGANIRTINSDLPPSFLTNPDPKVGNLLEIRQLFEDRMRRLHSDHQFDMNRLKRLMEEIQQRFDDRCTRLALDYQAATKHSVHTLR